MRVLFVVQRYGLEVAGGAEAACRSFAEELARRGHAVDVLTSSALRYTDWADHFPPGTTEIEGVRVHRQPVVTPRIDRRFGPVHVRMLRGERQAPLAYQQLWARLEGPDLVDLVPWLQAHAGEYDVACFVTYLYPPTIFGMAAARPHVATMFMPAAHDEPPLYFPLFDTVFRQADAFAFYTPEERALVVRRFGFQPPGGVTGIGIDLVGPGNGARFRAQFALGDRPYLLYLGRVDPAKGSLEALEFFAAYKQRHDDDLAMVVMGERVAVAPEHPDVVYTGFVDEEAKRDGLAGALALVQPSYFESFSIVLCEAWVQGVPALVQGECEVLAGQARRSGGAIAYRGFARFEAAVELLVEDEGRRAALGAAGRRYVEEHYRWPVVLDAFEAVASQAQSRRAARLNGRARAVAIAPPGT